jgi:hypothetical protein
MKRYIHWKLVLSLVASLLTAGSLQAQKPKHNKKDKVSLSTDYFATKVYSYDLLYTPVAYSKKPGKQSDRIAFSKQRSEALNNRERGRKELPKMKHGKRQKQPAEISPSR